MESQHFVKHTQVPADVLHSYGDGLARSSSAIRVTSIMIRPVRSSKTYYIPVL